MDPVRAAAFDAILSDIANPAVPEIDVVPAADLFRAPRPAPADEAPTTETVEPTPAPAEQARDEKGRFIAAKDLNDATARLRARLESA